MSTTQVAVILNTYERQRRRWRHGVTLARLM
jgi:hypothetical protein